MTEQKPEWAKEATHVDPGLDAWEIMEGVITVGYVYSEFDADSILSDRALVQRYRTALEEIAASIPVGPHHSVPTPQYIARSALSGEEKP